MLLEKISVGVNPQLKSNYLTTEEPLHSTDKAVLFPNPEQS